jgi:hypothetical protein
MQDFSFSKISGAGPSVYPGAPPSSLYDLASNKFVDKASKNENMLALWTTMALRSM